MTSPYVDPQALARSRIATQYLNSPKFLAYINALALSGKDIEDFFQLLAVQRGIDDAEGVQLDFIGDIVGVSRFVPNAIPFLFFGYQGYTGHTRFGEEGLPGIGARFYNEGEATSDSSVLLDPEFRLLIRAKIVRNHTDGTMESIINGLVTLFQCPVVVKETGVCELSIAIGRELSYTEQALITVVNILPKPGGVSIARRGYFDWPPGEMDFNGLDEMTIDGIVATEF